MQFFGKSDMGKRRRENQDSFITEQLYDNAVLCLVCDGMGGANGGSIASALACREFTKHIKKKLSDMKQEEQVRFDDMNLEAEKLLKRATMLTNTAVFKKALKEKELEGMGTTLVSALIINDKLYITNVGDSRLYLVNKNEMTRMTRDHSYVQTLIDLGQITPEEAEKNPHKNIITKAIGTQKKVDPDLFFKDLSDGAVEYILICSDGLTNFVEEKEIHKIINESENLEKTCDILISRANENGGGDNITAVLIKLDTLSSDNETE
ncbi:MAG: Stp1/IreP family PP2C-type Ser/Thr phosphatase [Clostridia bacterium]|nr:Stp1/IreP family PP2C-type Ser/Thr phosphatase [Clostridia bacterium]